jgi:hypothetical protein
VIRRFASRLAFAPLLCAAVACQPPQPASPRTLDSPRDVAAVRFCPIVDEALTLLSVTTVLDDGTCLDGALPESRALVANGQGEELHVIDLDIRVVGYIDLNDGLPGETGVRVPEGTSLVGPSAHPALAVAASTIERTLSIINVPLGRTVAVDGDRGEAEHYPLSGRPSILETVPLSDTGRRSAAVIHYAATNEFVAYEVATGCITDGSFDMSCAQRVRVTELGRFSAGAPATDMAVLPTGVVYAALRGRNTVVEFGLFGEALALQCGGTPCELRALALGPECANGVDDDGDGFIDARDAQCFGAAGNEAGEIVANNTLSACTNGLDDDADGLVDADDPECDSAADRDESEGTAGDSCLDGVDNDIDGLTDAEDPDCVATDGERRVTPATLENRSDAPRCSNGIDDDNDGLLDWPQDNDCYSAADDGEAEQVRPQPTHLGLAPEGDILVVADGALNRVYFFDTASGDLIDVNAGDPWDTAVGERLPSGLPRSVIVDTITSTFDVEAPTGVGEQVEVRELTQTVRLAHVAVTAGVAYTYSLDVTRSVAGSDGSMFGTVTEPRFRLFDDDGRRGFVDNVTCDIPRDLADLYAAINNIGCSDPRFPRPVVEPSALANGVICAGEVETTDEGGLEYLNAPGDAFAVIPTEVQFAASPSAEALCDGAVAPSLPGENGFAPINVPFDTWLRTDDIELTWEGVLPGASRQDGVLTGDVLQALAGRPCQDGVDFCTALSALELQDECSAAADLCNAGVDVCEDIDPCVICPALCVGAADFCASGVRAGDTVVVEPLRAEAEQCAPFSRGDAVSLDGLFEYRVIEVAPNTLRLEPIDGAVFAAPASADTGLPFLSALPPEGCQDGPLEYEIRSGNSFAVAGRDFMNFSPYEARGGECVLRADADERQDRLVLADVSTDGAASRLNTFFGLSLSVAPAQVPFRLRIANDEGTPLTTLRPPRGFTLIYDLNSRYQVRQATTDNRFLRLGPATSGGFVTDTNRGRRLLFIDEGRDELLIYDATSLVLAATALP